MRGRILLVPQQSPGGGTGHLRRCLHLAEALGERGIVCIQDRLPPGRVVPTTQSTSGPWDLVVLDRRATTRDEVVALAGESPVAVLDDGGEGRDLACYVLDIIPGGPKRRCEPNEAAYHYLDLPDPGRDTPPPVIRSVLVTFGGEDRLGLTERFVAAATRAGLRDRLAFTVVEGPRFGRSVRAPGMRIVKAPETLTPLFLDHDLTVTSYGLTLFESLSAGTPAVLLSPTPYHQRLGRRAGIPGIGLRRPRLERLLRLVSRPRALWLPVARFRKARASSGQGPGGYRGLAARLSALADALPEPRALAGACPVCSRPASPSLHRSIARFVNRTYYRCPATGLVYAVPFQDRPRVYDERYFFEEYRAQYGKTYLEDFDKIADAGRGRVALMSDFVSRPGPVLDVGCAYGPFLVACREAGYRAVGLDVSAEAVQHVRTRLGLEALHANFAEADLVSLIALRPRALTMWYVIEHFPGLGGILRRANALLPKGGLLALSTPSSSGVSARSDWRGFLERSPMDHYTIWSPACARATLSPYGFHVVRARVTGHHPERSGLLRRAGGLGGRLSRLFGLGDTFEVYAIKTRDVESLGEVTDAQ